MVRKLRVALPRNEYSRSHGYFRKVSIALSIYTILFAVESIRQLKDLMLQNKATIYIFDRYGKLVKQILPFRGGWDGTYNGSPLPASDYWFTLTFSINGQEREFKAHFSLVR